MGMTIEDCVCSTTYGLGLGTMWHSNRSTHENFSLEMMWHGPGPIGPMVSFWMSPMYPTLTVLIATHGAIRSYSLLRPKCRRLGMSRNDGGYAGGCSSRVVELHVHCLNGEGCVLSLCLSTLCREVYKVILEQLPSKEGTHLALHHSASSLILDKSLGEQLLSCETATLSATCIPTDLVAAWKYLQGLPVTLEELTLQGLTRIEGAPGSHPWHHLP